jgi:hypothetical protein
MGKTNRLAGNERKLAMLIGEQRALREKIAQARKIIADLAFMESRIEEIDKLIVLGEQWIKDDHPDWTGDHLRPKVPFVHDSPIRFGNGTRLALAIVREAYFPMTVREITVEACRREGHDKVDTPTIERLTSTIGNGLSAAKKRGVPVDHDGGYPARWFSTVESNDLPKSSNEVVDLSNGTN